MRLMSITSPVIWSNVLISVTREWRYFGLVYKFFQINNTVKIFVCLVPKTSQLMVKFDKVSSLDPERLALLRVKDILLWYLALADL